MNSPRRCSAITLPPLASSRPLVELQFILPCFSTHTQPHLTMSSISLKKKVTAKKPLLKKPLFADDSDDETKTELQHEEIGEFGGFTSTSKPSSSSKPPSKPLLKDSKPALKPLFKRPATGAYNDLSSTFTSAKHSAVAEELDANIYEYDSVYDSLKPAKKDATSAADKKKPGMMSSLLAAAAVRKRDATIAEEKRLLREREAEGDEYADKEKFVTSAYKLQQAENRRIEEEERVREEEEAKKNSGAGLTGFYKQMLQKQEEEHAMVVKAVEEKIKSGVTEEEEVEQEKTAADIARELNAKEGRKIAINDNGEVVDERDLLKGGLNIKSKPKTTTQAPTRVPAATERNYVGAGGSKQAMRERQTRMMEAQLEQATKRALEQDEEEQAKVERAAKSQKTEGDIMGAKERYLARKREAEQAKKRGDAA